MRKIVLLCAAGMSTSMLVTKMRKAAEETNYECDINAYATTEASRVGEDADIILLGPQVRFELSKVRGLFPNKPVESIEMAAYGMMDGKAVLTFAKKHMGD